MENNINDDIKKEMEITDFQLNTKDSRDNTNKSSLDQETNPSMSLLKRTYSVINENKSPLSNFKRHKSALTNNLSPLNKNIIKGQHTTDPLKNINEKPDDDEEMLKNSPKNYKPFKSQLNRTRTTSETSNSSDNDILTHKEGKNDIEIKIESVVPTSVLSLSDYKTLEKKYSILKENYDKVNYDKIVLEKSIVDNVVDGSGIRKLYDNLETEYQWICERNRRAGDFIIQKLRDEGLQEREEIKRNIAVNNINIGKFNSSDNKWTEGKLFIDVREKLRVLREDKLNIEKEYKIKLNQYRKLVTSHPDDYKEYNDYVELNRKLKRLDIDKNSLSTKEKQYQDELDHLNKTKSIHIRQIRLNSCQENSKFNHFNVIDNRYHLLNMLGKGGFSEVYKCYDMEEMKYVAVKIQEFSARHVESGRDSYIKHMVREFRIHQSLDHPNIVSIYSAFYFGFECFCTVLEYCSGNDLDSVLKRYGSLPEKKSKDVIFEVVEALRYLNDRSIPIIHYDLKPANILMDAEGNHVKISDFGLSKWNQERPSGDMEMLSHGCGTYWYLPPECFDDSPVIISSKIDVWSVGVIFYQCLYGKRPFADNASQAQIYKEKLILNAPPIEFPKTIHVSEGAKKFMKTCCTKDRQERPDVLTLHKDNYLEFNLQNKVKISDTDSVIY